LADGWSVDEARLALVILTGFHTFDLLFSGPGHLAKSVRDVLLELARSIVERVEPPR